MNRRKATENTGTPAVAAVMEALRMGLPTCKRECVARAEEGDSYATRAQAGADVFA